MRHLAILSLLAAALLCALSMPVLAQALPNGSYLQSCRDIEVRGKNRPDAQLIAECQTKRGSWRESSLLYKRCRGDIYNDNGALGCKGASSGNAGGLPSGNWRSSCRDAYFDGRTLQAECRTLSGRWQQAMLNLNACPGGPVANINGRLVCATGNVGGYSRLTLYQDFDFGGRALQLTGAAPDLRNFNFNDRASSLRVQGNWYVCTDIGYRGECTKVVGSFNLNSKWNKRISSARPAQ